MHLIHLLHPYASPRRPPGSAGSLLAADRGATMPGAMTAPTDKHDDELGSPAFEDLSDEARERDLEQGHRAAIETAIAQLRAGDAETARRTLAARLEEAERCPICGVRDGEACDASTHERAELEGSTQGTTQ